MVARRRRRRRLALVEHLIQRRRLHLNTRHTSVTAAGQSEAAAVTLTMCTAWLKSSRSAVTAETPSIRRCFLEKKRCSGVLRERQDATLALNSWFSLRTTAAQTRQWSRRAPPATGSGPTLFDGGGRVKAALPDPLHGGVEGGGQQLGALQVQDQLLRVAATQPPSATSCFLCGRVLTCGRGQLTSTLGSES